MLKRVFVILLAMAVTPALTAAMAEENGQSCDTKVVRITGENIELLAATGGGEADEKFGKLYALKVEKAEDDAGNCLDDVLKGRILCYVPTRAAAALLAGEMKGKVTVTGKLIGGTVLVVESAAAAEEKNNGEENPAGATGEKKDNEKAGGNDDEWEEIGVKTLSQQQVI